MISITPLSTLISSYMQLDYILSELSQDLDSDRQMYRRAEPQIDG